MYDLNLMPIHFHQGQPVPDTVGIYAFAPPRRAARGRSEDLLILSLSLEGSDRISPEIQQDWLDRLANIFYKTSGSATAALRTLIETLNLTIMEKNLKSAQDGLAVTGAVNLAVVHRRSLYIAQCGMTHAFVLNHQGLQHYADASMSDRGLGVSRTPTIRYYQDEVGTGAYFFTTDTPPESWTDSLIFSENFPNFDQLRRRLLNQAPPNFRMGLAQITPGEGRINLIQSATRTSETVKQQPSVERQTPFPPKESPSPTPMQTTEINPTKEDDLRNTREARSPAEPAGSDNQNVPQRKPDELEVAADAPQAQPTPQPQPRISHLRSTPEPDSTQPSRRQRPSKETGAAAREVLNQQKAQFQEKGLKGLAAVLLWVRNVRESVDNFFKDLIARWSPGESNGTPRLSRNTLIFIAVAVPLVVVAIAAGVYLSRGRTQQYQYYYSQAMAYAQSATITDDPAVARSWWMTSLDFLDQAGSYRTTDEMEQLRDQAQDALDVLDGAVRLDYRPAIIGSLYSEINITRIVSFGADLYLLDEAGGRVIHAVRKSQGYEVDPDFICAAGSFEGGAVDLLVDMVSLPINNPYQAHVLAVDAMGNVAYCAAGREPIVIALPKPSANEGEIKAIAYNSGYLYALNPLADSIRVYRAINGQFLDAPTEFFEGADLAEKPDLTQIVDLAANGQELYLLRNDGMLVDCVSSGLPSDPVNCENPVTYVDGRPGLEDQPLTMPDSTYDSVLYTDPPDPSVSVLDAANADIYRFSLRFRLHQRLRPEMGQYEVNDSTATAFTIGIDRIAFLAFGHQLFFAYVE